MDKTEAKWMFLTEQLGWKEGLPKEGPLRPDKEERKENNVGLEATTLLAEHLFLTKQMGWRKGLKVFQDKGEKAIKKKLQQIHDMKGFAPKHWFEMTHQERARALKYLMHLKEKKDGDIKGQGCADGRPQRLYTPKNKTSLPTASLAGLILTCIIDAYKNRDVATVDLPGAFLQTKMPDDEDDMYAVLDG
jgi:hypothetical protein